MHPLPLSSSWQRQESWRTALHLPLPFQMLPAPDRMPLRPHECGVHPTRNPPPGSAAQHLDHLDPHRPSRGSFPDPIRPQLRDHMPFAALEHSLPLSPCVPLEALCAWRAALPWPSLRGTHDQLACALAFVCGTLSGIRLVLCRRTGFPTFALRPFCGFCDILRIRTSIRRSQMDACVYFNDERPAGV